MKRKDRLLSTENDRILPKGKPVPKSPKPQQAPWTWERFHTMQEILDDLKGK